MERGLSRRGLLGAGAGLAATAAVGTHLTRPERAAAEGTTATSACSLLPPDRIGLQLYSLAAPIQELGFEKVLQTVAEIGFKHVEFAGYTDGRVSLSELRALLDAHGLTASGSHVSPSDDASMEKILDEAEVLGIPHVGVSLVLPSGLLDTAGWAATARQYNRYGELAAERGMTFYMHNHFQEWLPVVDDPSRRAIDVLLAESDPRHVGWEMDIFWAYAGRAQALGGFDPLHDYALRYLDRIKLFHVKDGIPGELNILDAGAGVIDFQFFFTQLFAQAPQRASELVYLWERDNADDHPAGALASARTSYAFIRHALRGTGDCAPAPFRAKVSGVRVRGRRVRAALRLAGDARVTATLRRDGRTLARSARDVAAGRRTVALRVPKDVAPGRATLVLEIAGASGSVTLRRAVHLRTS